MYMYSYKSRQLECHFASGDGSRAHVRLVQIRRYFTAQFTRFTGKKVHKMTPEELLQRSSLRY